MPANLSNLKVLIADPKIIQQGAVVKALLGNKFLVDLGNGQMVQAFYNGVLAKDQSVVVGKAPSGWEILTLKNLAAKNILSIRIRG